MGDFLRLGRVFTSGLRLAGRYRGAAVVGFGLAVVGFVGGLR